jgi:hypothetical protein
MSFNPINVRRTIVTATSVALVVLAWSPYAHAHGGMVGPEELGPPLTISAALAFAGYWLMILWPSKPRPEPEEATIKQAHRTPGVAGRRREHSVRLVKKVTSGDNSGTVKG